MKRGKKKAEIASREMEQRRKIRDEMRKVLEEMSRVRNNPNSEQPATNFDNLYMEELELAFIGSILRNQVMTLRKFESFVASKSGSTFSFDSWKVERKAFYAEAKILRGPHEDVESYLEAVDQLRSNIRFFSSNKNFESSNGVLNHANNLLSKVILKLEEEFRQLLTSYRCTG
ncbi:hypothetical protein Syun_012020 [Stephania yunnanensis]|uniref:Uncharacterized protein n=1 Tax=Stephania yunnanensis TaxID=152371 RepID=A0AAP0K0X4_9MAGN